MRATLKITNGSNDNEQAAIRAFLKWKNCEYDLVMANVDEQQIHPIVEFKTGYGKFVANGLIELVKLWINRVAIGDINFIETNLNG